ncbi:MAG: hydroxymethylbilane synthase [SAR324 cluster bacterium]|nr:hydroxymethylbilane synthase [SAR324 cluster bacterium]
MTTTTLRIGTRGSQLALWQANWIRDQILAKFPEIIVDLVIIKTTGDMIQDRPLSEIGGKGLFVKEIETALMENKVDLAVHSMKDVPSWLPEPLEIAVITKREHPGDALLSEKYKSLEELPSCARIGTSSLRRSSQLKALRKDLIIEPLRGNVDTRLRKLKEGNYDAIILAYAGLKRLGLDSHVTRIIDPSQMLPAVAQGIVGIEVRKQDAKTLSFLQHLHHHETAACLEAERALLVRLEGNCQIPLAGFARLNNRTVTLEGLLASPDGTTLIRHIMSSPEGDGQQLGKAMGDYLLDHGGHQILDQLKSTH